MFWDGYTRHKMAKKLMSIFVIFAFFANFVVTDAWAIELVPEPIFTMVSPTVERFAPLDVETFTLPPHLGTLKFSHKGDTDRLIIHIQDAHCNYGAQKRISEIIGYLVTEYGITDINLEGGVGSYDLSIFTGIADEGIREKVADHFVMEGMVNGAEYYAVNHPDEVTLWGIEDPGLYMSNISVYWNSQKDKGEVEKILGGISHVMDNLKPHIYTEELLEVDKKYEGYKAGSIEFKDYLTFLMQKAKEQMIDSKDYPNIYLLYQSLQQEGNIDFKKANTQRDVLVERLQGMLSKKALQELVIKTVDFKTKTISQFEFYDFLVKKAKLVDISLDEYPELQKYIVYITLYHAADRFMIMTEIDRIETDIKSNLYENNKQRELNVLSKNLTLMKNLFDISLTKEDYKYYKENKAAFEANNFISFINREAPSYKISARPPANASELDIYRGNLEQFYEYSFRRDDAFMDNITFTDRGRKAAIVVTGGFHTENLCDLYKEANVSYVSIIPDFKNEKGYKCPYFDLLEGKRFGMYEIMYEMLAPASLIQIASYLSSLGEDVWDRRSIDAFKAAVLIVAENQKAIPEGNAVDAIEKKGDSIVIRWKTGPVTVEPIRALLHKVHERETDAQMEKLNEENPDAFQDIPEIDEIINNDLLPFMEAMGVPPDDDVSTIVKGLTGKSFITDESLVRTVEGVDFDGTPGGYGIRINAKFIGPDGKIIKEGRATILHEIVGGIYGDHFLSKEVEEAYKRNNRRDKLLEGKTPLKKRNDVGEVVTAAVWGMTEAQRLEVDRDYTAPASPEAGVLVNKMNETIERMVRNINLGAERTDKKSIDDLGRGARHTCQLLNNFMLGPTNYSPITFAQNGFRGALLGNIDKGEKTSKVVENLTSLLVFYEQLRDELEALGFGKAERFSDIGDFFSDADQALRNYIITRLNNAEFTAELAGNSAVLAVLAGQLDPAQASNLAIAFQRVRRNLLSGKTDIAQNITEAAQMMMRNQKLSPEQARLLFAKEGPRVGAMSTAGSAEIIRSAFMVEGTDLHDFFAALSEEDQTKLIESMKNNLGVTYFQEGETFINAGDPNDRSAYFVLSGGYRVDYPLIGEAGTKTVFSTDNGRGQLIGEIALIHKTRRNADVVADSPMRVMVMSEETLNRVFEGRRDLRDKFFAAVDEVVGDREEKKQRVDIGARYDVVGPIGRDQASALKDLIDAGIVSVNKVPTGRDLSDLLVEALAAAKKIKIRDDRDRQARDRGIAKVEDLMNKGTATFDEMMDTLGASYRKSVIPILKDLMDEEKELVSFSVDAGKITDATLLRVGAETGKLDFKTLNSLVNVQMTNSNELEDLQGKLGMFTIGFDRAVAEAVRRDREVLDRESERKRNLESFKNALSTTIDGILNIYNTRGLLRYDRSINDEGDIIKASLERMIDLYLQSRMWDRESNNPKALEETDARQFVDLLSFSLNTYVAQKGGVAEVTVTDEAGDVKLDEKGNPVKVKMAYGSGGNRLRGSNGAIHAIINSDKVEAMAANYNGALAMARRDGKISQDEYNSRFITPELLLESRVALMMHDTMAGNIRNANAGLGIFGDVDDLKAGHGAAATKYLDSDTLDPLVRGLFGADGKSRIVNNIAYHDYQDIDFSNPEQAVMTMTEIADNTAAAEKFMDAFTRVTANNGLLGKLHELSELCTIGGKLNKGLYAKLIEGIRDQMIENIDRAAQIEEITQTEADTYKYTVINDLNIMTAGMSIAAYNAGAFRGESTRFDLATDGEKITDVTMTVVQERGYSDAEYKALFGDELADKHIRKITAEPYGKKSDTVKAGDKITREGLVMEIVEPIQVNTRQANNVAGLVNSLIRARRETFALMGAYQSDKDILDVVKLYFGLSDHEMKDLSDNLGGPVEVVSRFTDVISLDQVNELKRAAAREEGLLEPEIVPARPTITLGEAYSYAIAVNKLPPATPEEVEAAKSVINAIATESPATARSNLKRVRSLEEMNDGELEYLERQLSDIAGNRYRNTAGQMEFLGADIDTIKNLDAADKAVEDVYQRHRDVVRRVDRLAWALEGNEKAPGPWYGQWGNLKFQPWRKPIVLAKSKKVFERVLDMVMAERARKLKVQIEGTLARMRTADKERAWLTMVADMLAEAKAASPILQDRLFRVLGLYYWMDKALGKDHVYGRLIMADRGTFQQARTKGLIYLSRFPASDFLGTDKISRFQYEIEKANAEIALIKFAEEFAGSLIENDLAAENWAAYRRYTLPIETLLDEEYAQLTEGARVLYERMRSQELAQKESDAPYAKPIQDALINMAADRPEMIDFDNPVLLHMVDMAIMQQMFDSAKGAFDNYKETGDMGKLNEAHQYFTGTNSVENVRSRITDAAHRDQATTTDMKKDLMNYTSKEDEFVRDLRSEVENRKKEYFDEAARARRMLDASSNVVQIAIEEGGELNRDGLSRTMPIPADIVLKNAVLREKSALDMLGVREDASDLEKQYFDVQERISQFDDLRRDHIQNAKDVGTILKALQVEPESTLGKQLMAVELDELKTRARLTDRALGYDIFTTGTGLDMLTKTSDELQMRAARKRAFIIGSTSTEEAVQSLTGRDIKPFSGYQGEAGFEALKVFIDRLVNWGVDIYSDKAPVNLMISNPATIEERKEIVDKYGLKTDYLTLTSSKTTLLEMAFKKAGTIEEALEIIKDARLAAAPENADAINTAHGALKMEQTRLEGWGLNEEQESEILDEMKSERYGYKTLKNNMGVTTLRRMAVNVATNTPQVFSFLNSDMARVDRTVLKMTPDQVVTILGDLEKSEADGGYGFQVYRGEGLDFLNSNLPLVLRAIQLTEQQMDAQLKKGQFGMPKDWQSKLEEHVDKTAMQEYDKFRKTVAGKKTIKMAMADAGIQDPTAELGGINKDAVDNGKRVLNAVRERIVDLTQYGHQETVLAKPLVDLVTDKDEILKMLREYLNIATGPDATKTERMTALKKGKEKQYTAMDVRILKAHLVLLREREQPYTKYTVGYVDPVAKAISELEGEIARLRDNLSPAAARTAVRAIKPALVSNGALGEFMDNVRTMDDLKSLVGDQVAMNKSLRNKIDSAFDKLFDKMRSGGLPDDDPGIMTMVQNMVGTVDMSDEDKGELRSSIIDNMYLFNTKVEGEENYLLGFSMGDDALLAPEVTGKIGLSAELVETLDPIELAEFIFHEMYEMDYSHGEIYGKTDRENSIQGKIFGRNTLKNKLRNFINMKAKEYQLALLTEAAVTPGEAAEIVAGAPEGAAIGDNVEARQVVAVAAGEEIERRSDPVRIVVGVVYNLEDHAAFQTVERGVRDMNSEVKAKFGIKPDNQQIITFKIMPGNMQATAKEYKKALDNANRTLPEGGRIVSYTPQMKGLEMVDTVDTTDEFKEYRDKERITFVKDAYTDGINPETGGMRPPDIAVRFVLARQIAFCLNSTNPDAKRMGLDYIKDLLTRISGAEIAEQLAGVNDLNTLLDRLFLKIRAVDYEEIRDWQMMQEAVAVSL